MRPDGRMAYVSCDKSGQVAEIDLRSGRSTGSSTPARWRTAWPGPRPVDEVLAVASVAFWLAAAPVLAHKAPLGVFEAHGDVGAPKIAGSAAYNPVDAGVTLSAAGTNMWGPRTSSTSSGSG